MLDVAGLSFPSLGPVRERVVGSLVSLCADEESAVAALKLGPRQRDEVLHNRELRVSPVLPALERYSGVLFDAIGAGTLSNKATDFCAEQVLIHSALLGLVGAADPIPAYRLSHNSRLPGLSLTSVWAGPVSAALDDAVREDPRKWVLDLRSEAYVKLGPAPPASSVFVRVVSRGADGTVRALNHFNKKAKGEFVRTLAESGIVHTHPDELVAWAKDVGVGLSAGSPGELVLDAAHARPRG